MLILSFASEAEGGVFAFEPGFMIWSAVTFALLVALLWKLGWGPLTQMIEEREQKIRADIAAAEKARKEADAAMAEYQRKLDEAATEAKKTLEAAREAAERAKQSIIDEAESQADALKARAEKDIAAARDRAIADLRAQVVDLAVTISRKVVSEKIDEKEHQRLANEVLAKAGDLN